MLSKFVGAQESHGAPPGLYLLLFWVTFWPGATLAGMAAPAVWRARREPGAQFLLAWLMPSWIVFELVITKLPHYVLPLYPAIAILIGRRAGAQRAVARAMDRCAVRRGGSCCPPSPPCSAIVGAIMLTRQPVFLAWPFVAGALIFGLFAWWLYDDYRAERRCSTPWSRRCSRGRHLRRRGAGADAAVSEPGDRARAAQRRTASARRPPRPAFTSRASSSWPEPRRC